MEGGAVWFETIKLFMQYVYTMQFNVFRILFIVNSNFLIIQNKKIFSLLDKIQYIFGMLCYTNIKGNVKPCISHGYLIRWFLFKGCALINFTTPDSSLDYTFDVCKAFAYIWMNQNFAIQ